MIDNVDGEKRNHEGVPKSDKMNFLILLFLYILQGIPIGIISSVKILLRNKNVSYKEQAKFSLVDWPFSTKLLWAPIVDSLYWKHLGRRKTWLIPTQYLIGFLMLILSTFVSSLMDNSPDIISLTVSFFCLNFLVATQDIAVDGWAVSMLSRPNVAFATVCNSAGQRIGYFLGHVVFLVLDSPEFCNKYLRSIPQPDGIVNLAGFLKISGITFIISTSLVLIFKSEKKTKCVETLGIRDTYIQLYKIMCLKNVLILITFLMTFQVALAATDSVTKLKFIEAGVRKENLALLEAPLVLFQVIIPLYISRYTTGINPLNVFLKAFPYKLMFGLLFGIIIWWTRYIKLESGTFPTYYYVVIGMIFILHQAVITCIFLPLGSFFNKVSDPSIGGTYMTLLNTFYNLGASCASTLALWLVDVLTFKECDNPAFNCDNAVSTLKCTDAGHSCFTVLDGYYIETVICALLGLLWLRWGRKVIHKLQGSPLSEWKTSQYSPLQSLETDFTKA